MPTTRRCPECTYTLDEAWFQPPVRCCLDCYSKKRNMKGLGLREAIESGDPTVAENAWKRVRQLASMAPYGGSGQARRRRHFKHLASMGVKPPPEMLAFIDPVPSGPPGVSAGSTKCDACGNVTDKPLEFEEMFSDEEHFERAVLCFRCHQERAELEKQCQLCQKVFPLGSMRVKDAKVYCPICFSKRVKKTPGSIVLSILNQNPEGEPT